VIDANIKPNNVPDTVAIVDAIGWICEDSRLDTVKKEKYVMLNATPSGTDVSRFLRHLNNIFIF
jgi:hypothetical protein